MMKNSAEEAKTSSEFNAITGPKWGVKKINREKRVIADTRKLGKRAANSLTPKIRNDAAVIQLCRIGLARNGTGLPSS